MRIGLGLLFLFTVVSVNGKFYLNRNFKPSDLFSEKENTTSVVSLKKGNDDTSFLMKVSASAAKEGLSTIGNAVEKAVTKLAAGVDKIGLGVQMMATAYFVIALLNIFFKHYL